MEMNKVVNCGDFVVVKNNNDYVVKQNTDTNVSRGIEHKIVFINDGEKRIFESILEDIQNACNMNKRFTLIQHLIEAFI